MSALQPTKLFPTLLEPLDDSRRIAVLNIGPATPETIAFFSHSRCRLHVVDLFTELPIQAPPDDAQPLAIRLGRILGIAPGTRFDLCLFWDLFNYVNADVTRALMAALRPYIHSGTRAHCFGVHNARAEESAVSYGVADAEHFVTKQRQRAIPNYAPHSQSALQSLLADFEVVRSVLLAGSRLEMVMTAR